MYLILANKQRRRSLDLEKIQATMELLLKEVEVNVKGRPPAWLKEKSINLTRIFQDGTLSCQLLSNRAIALLNKDWRDKPVATDVLSFPIELELPLHLGAVKSGQVEANDWPVGELFISVERALEQAEEYGHSFEREMSFLFVHGCLHVLGFDHLTKAEEKEMFRRQREILSQVGILR